MNQMEVWTLSITNQLPGGPSAIPVYGNVIFPPRAWEGNGTAMAAIVKSAEEGTFPVMGSILFPALFYAIVFGILRTVFTKLFFKPLAMYSRQLKEAPKIEWDSVIEQHLIPVAIARAKADKEAEKKNLKKNPKDAVAMAAAASAKKIDHSKPTNAEVIQFVKEYPCTKYTENYVNKYLWNRRRYKNFNLKITKFVEAFWRFLFYAAFVIIGYYGLFKNPTTVNFIDDLSLLWSEWPNTDPTQQLSSFLKLYYQLELGCYLHQLYWTEVDRKDATEMIIHHCSTILLILWSWCTNLTRIGTLILLIHDIADIFLESAKCINYAAISKGPMNRKWLSPICDTLFAIFAITFGVSRLYIYPRYCVAALIFDSADIFQTRNWFGYWIFSALLCTLQALHIMWFYMILKMVYGLLQKGNVEGDVRSDDEGDEDEEWTESTEKNKTK